MPLISIHIKWILLSCLIIVPIISEKFSSRIITNGKITLRIRRSNEYINRVNIDPSDFFSSPLSVILDRIIPSKDLSNDARVLVGISDINISKSPLDNGLSHGDVITILNPRHTELFENDRKFKTLFDPFPPLSKRSLFTNKKRSVQFYNSYTDLLRHKELMHHIHPQKAGAVKRIYICSISAQRFFRSFQNDRKYPYLCNNKSLINRCMILFGTIETECISENKHSECETLQSHRSENIRNSIRVHAACEFPVRYITYKNNFNSKIYNVKDFWESQELSYVKNIADKLGLNIVGWMFPCSEECETLNMNSREKKGMHLFPPILARDILVAAAGQIASMLSYGRNRGRNFVTVVMNTKTGVTEAFQLSDICVQMMAEGVFSYYSSTGSIHELQKPDEERKRIIKTYEPVMVDSKKVFHVDSTLFIINTALMCHMGRYSGNENIHPLRKNGGLTLKMRKKLLLLLEECPEEICHLGDNGAVMSKLIGELCDLNTLIVLNKFLLESDMNELYLVVRKYANGQRRGLYIGTKLRLHLVTYLML